MYTTVCLMLGARANCQDCPAHILLLTARMHAQAEALAEILGVDLSEGGPLLAALRSSDKVTVHPDGTLQYKVPLQR